LSANHATISSETVEMQELEQNELKPMIGAEAEFRVNDLQVAGYYINIICIIC